MENIRRSLANRNVPHGKAEPFRTGCGKAAVDFRDASVVVGVIARGG